MSKSKDIHDPESVTAHIKNLDADFAALADAVRQVILGADKEIGEQIKWNAPSFFYTGAMKAFDAKEYKRDIVVFNLRKGVVLLVFPTGAIINDHTGLLEGDYKDGRRMVTFKDLAAVEAGKEDLQQVIRQWLELVEK